MQETAQAEVGRISLLLRSDTDQMKLWAERWDWQRIAQCIAIIFVGAGLYGASMGWWRDPQQGLYTAIKFPLIFLLTTFGNALLNAMLAPLLGLNIPFRQSFFAILMSFVVASAILGSFSPLVGFLIWNSPPMLNAEVSGTLYSIILLTHVVVIAFAGIVANLHLRNLLQELGGNPRIAHRVLLAWLAGNLFLGSQLTWIFRPFIGSPGLPVQFLRHHPLKGSFWETIFHALVSLWNYLTTP
jgi:hypothetical protein